MIRLNFFGDIVVPATQSLTIGKELNGLIEKGTYNIINCEVPCIPPETKRTPIEKSGPSLNQDHKTIEWLRRNGFNLFSLANNHMMDFGEDGLESTRKLLKGEMMVGAGNWEEAYSPAIIESEGKRIAVFALTQYEFGTLADQYTDSKGVAWINHPSLIGRILDIRKSVDYLFIFAHAGVENIEQPLPEWRSIYKQFIDLGCDGVIASHPHIIQGYEYYKDKPIVYSLGNFYFGTKDKKPGTWYRSICFSIEIKENTISCNSTPISFNDNYIEVDHSNETKNYINRINATLSDEQEYISYINKECERLLEIYYDLFLAGGLLKISKPHKIVKPIAKKLIRGKSHNIEHMVNNIRCESHRWAIMRAIKNKYNVL